MFDHHDTTAQAVFDHEGGKLQIEMKTGGSGTVPFLLNLVNRREVSMLFMPILN
jgi:hypothetical protein